MLTKSLVTLHLFYRPVSSSSMLIKSLVTLNETLILYAIELYIMLTKSSVYALIQRIIMINIMIDQFIQGFDPQCTANYSICWGTTLVIHVIDSIQL